MIVSTPRVAYFPDSFHEVNGVANTSRQFEAFARRHNLPFLCVRAGGREEAFREEGSVWTLELPRSAMAFAVEKDLSFDPAFPRHFSRIGSVLRQFKPDLIHITGPSELGIFGAALARRLHVPLAAGWHTNLHEYVGRRVRHLLRVLPGRSASAAGRGFEGLTLAATKRFYALGQIFFAPNPQLCAMLEGATGRACHYMPRGVDTELFNPAKRSRKAEDRGAVLGYVGRLSVEKNVALLARIQQELEQRGVADFRFLIVGHGAEEARLRGQLRRAEFTGVLRGEALAEAYANMDLFVFPSHTDTFGNVVLEALASGVPAVVTPNGGPCTIVRDGATGRVAGDGEFSAAIAELLADPAELDRMRAAARADALKASWDAVFEDVYAAYQTILPVNGSLAARRGEQELRAAD